MSDSRNNFNYWPILEQKVRQERNYWDIRAANALDNVWTNRPINDTIRNNSRNRLHHQKYGYTHYSQTSDSSSISGDIRERLAEDHAAVRGLFNSNPDACNWPSFGFSSGSGDSQAIVCHGNNVQARNVSGSGDIGAISFSYDVYTRGGVTRQELDLPQNMVAMLQKTSQNVFGLLQNVD